MKYEDILLSIQAVLDRPAGAVANLANTAAILKEYMEDVNWAGFYLLHGDELILGPFCGKVACVRIARGRGVCGAAVEENATKLVEDVFAFPGHIACDANSRSEVVVPLRDEKGNVLGVLDVDSAKFRGFTESDARGLECVARLVETLLWEKEA